MAHGKHVGNTILRRVLLQQLQFLESSEAYASFIITPYISSAASKPWRGYKVVWERRIAELLPRCIYRYIYIYTIVAIIIITIVVTIIIIVIVIIAISIIHI